MANPTKILEVVLELEDNFTGDLKQTATSAQTQATKIGGAMKTAGASLTAGLTLPIVGVGIHLANLGMTVVETESKIGTIFGDMSDDIEAWAETSTAALTQTNLAARDQASTMYAIAQGMGVADEAAFELSTTAVELAADFSSFYDLPVEEAFAKIRSGFTGEFESLKSLGIVLNQDIIAQTAYTHGLAVMGEELDQATKAEATLIAIMERSGEAVGDVARTQDSASNTVRQLQARFGDMKNELSQSFIPIIEELLDLAKPMLETIQGWADAFMEMTPEQQKTILAVLGIVAAIGPLLFILGQVIVIAPAIGAAVTFMFGPWGLAVLAVVAGVMLVIEYWDEIKFAAELVYTEIMKWFEPVVAWFVENGPLMAETWNAILGWIMDFWERWGPVFTNAWNAAWDNIKVYFSIVWDGIKTIFSVVFEIIGGILKTGMQLITGDWEGALETIKTTASNVWDDVTGYFERSLTAIYERFLGWFDDMKEGWTDFYNAIVGGSIVPEMADEIEYRWNVMLANMETSTDTGLAKVVQRFQDYYGAIIDESIEPEMATEILDGIAEIMSAMETNTEDGLSGVEDAWDTTLANMATDTDVQLLEIEERFVSFADEVSSTVDWIRDQRGFAPPGTSMMRPGAGTMETERALVESGQVPWTQYHAAMGIPPPTFPSAGSMLGAGTHFVGTGGDGTGMSEQEEIGYTFDSVITDTMAELNDHIIESFRDLGESIVSGDISSAIGDAIEGVGDIISDHIATRITANIGGGGLWGGIAGSLGGGLVGGLFSAFGGLFGKKKRRGETKADAIWVEMANAGDIAEAALNITKQFMSGLTARGINDITSSLHFEAQRINAS